MGKRGGKGRGRPQITGTDQYGEDYVDRNDGNHGFGGPSGRSGGAAESKSVTRPTGTSLEVERKVPKFLQQYAHLLEKGPKKRQKPDVADSEDEGDEGNAEAIERALEENPEARAAMEEAQLRRIRASAAKELGNAAFKAGDFDDAIKRYSEAIEADNTDAAFYSNRSAAYAAKGLWEEARQDAAQSAALKPGWAKAWSRLGAAYMGLQAWSEAKDTYGRAMVLEPDDKTVQTAWGKADYEERQASQAGKFRFNQDVQHPGSSTRKRGTVQSVKDRPSKRESDRAATGQATSAVRKLVSFDDDEGEEEA